MHGGLVLLDRAIPDSLPTTDLPIPVAAEVDHLAGRTAPWAEAGPDVQRGIRARALVVTGRVPEARRLLDDDGDGGDDDEAHQWVPGSQDDVAAVWAASRVGSPELLAALGRHLPDLDDRFLVGSSLGGVLLIDTSPGGGSLAHRSLADRSLADTGPGDEVPLGPVAQLHGLVAAGQGRLDDAEALLSRATVVADRRAPVWGALARLELGRVLASDGSRPAAARRALTAAGTFFAAGGYRYLAARVAAVTAPDPASGTAQPGLGHLVPGDRWEVGFGVVPPVEVPDTKGLAVLAHLVDNRRRQVPAVEVVALLEGRPTVAFDGFDPELLRASVELDGLDLTAELRAHFLDDRVRSRVSKLVWRTIAKLGEAHPLLGEHLAEHMRTGYSCRYIAPAGVAWRRSP